MKKKKKKKEEETREREIQQGAEITPQKKSGKKRIEKSPIWMSDGAWAKERERTGCGTEMPQR